MKNHRSGIRPKHWIAAALIALCLILLLQNAEVVSFNIFFWTISMSRIIAFPLLVLVGGVIGYILGRWARYGARR